MADTQNHGVKPKILGGLGRIGPDMTPCEVVINLTTPVVEQPTNCLDECEAQAKNLALITEMDISSNYSQEVRNAFKEDFPVVVANNTSNNSGSLQVQ